MMAMDYAYVDNLSADQLLEGDLIEINDEIVKVISIAFTKDGFLLNVENDFNEKEEIEVSDEASFKLFVMR